MKVSIYIRKSFFSFYFIKIRMDNNNLSISFKDKEVFNTSHFTLTRIRILLINEFAFNFIIYIWYLFFIFGIIKTPNPFFALILSLMQNVILLTYLLIKGISYSDLLKYTIILIVFKLFPIYSMRNNMSVSYFDVYSGIYLYIIYIFILLVVINVFLHKNYDIMKILQRDVTNNTYDTGLSSNVYDTVYNDIILRIL
jgi:hypothetical protein